VSWWNRVVVPRAVHQVLDTPAVFATRTEVLADVTGSIVELGFGSGLSLTCYPAAVHEVLAVDPDDTGWHMSQSARDQAAQRGLAVQRIGRDAERLPLADQSVDTVVTLWTLCTVPDMRAALSEITRVLRPGGRFVFAEHGPSTRARRRRFESLVEPIWTPLAGGCHLTREPWTSLADLGFTDIKVGRPAGHTGNPPGTRIGSAVRT
jgi:ubiquinone/menaquinone biosynthesis C-methylase UbiE